jgi:hypothetical protein
MHGRLRGFGRNRPDVLPRERRSRPRAESLGPRLGAHIPRCRARTTLGWPGPAPPDVNDFDHSAFSAPKPAPPRSAEYDAPFTGWGLCPLLVLAMEFLAREYAICFGHAFPCLWVVVSRRRPQAPQAAALGAQEHRHQVSVTKTHTGRHFRSTFHPIHERGEVA